MEKLVQAQLDAYNARDIESFCKCYHPDVNMIRFISGVRTVSNIDELRETYRELFENNPNLHCELRSRIILENVIFDEEFVTGLKRAPQGIHTVVSYGFRDGLIDRVWTPR